MSQHTQKEGMEIQDDEDFFSFVETPGTRHSEGGKEDGERKKDTQSGKKKEFLAIQHFFFLRPRSIHPSPTIFTHSQNARKSVGVSIPHHQRKKTGGEKDSVARFSSTFSAARLVRERVANTPHQVLAPNYVLLRFFN